MSTALVLYMPVIHTGYLKLLKENQGDVYIVDASLSETHTDYLQKELHALLPLTTAKIVRSLDEYRQVSVLGKSNVSSLLKYDRILMPDDDLSHSLHETYFRQKTVGFIKTFLRWDRTHVFSVDTNLYSATISYDPEDRKIMERLKEMASRSGDWWRGVAAAVVRDKEILGEGHNDHYPSPYLTYAHGDPRSCITPEESPDLATARHAEVAAISEAVKKHGSVEGCDIYVTTFPCRRCAIELASFGIVRCYFNEAHSALQTQEILTLGGIQLFRVP